MDECVAPVYAPMRSELILISEDVGRGMSEERHFTAFRKMVANMGQSTFEPRLRRTEVSA
jgi:hypothetical protein